MVVLVLLAFAIGWSPAVRICVVSIEVLGNNAIYMPTLPSQTFCDFQVPLHLAIVLVFITHSIDLSSLTLVA
jgi:hypothetical protein